MSRNGLATERLAGPVAAAVVAVAVLAVAWTRLYDGVGAGHVIALCAIAAVPSAAATLPRGRSPVAAAATLGAVVVVLALALRLSPWDLLTWDARAWDGVRGILPDGLAQGSQAPLPVTPGGPPGPRRAARRRPRRARRRGGLADRRAAAPRGGAGRGRRGPGLLLDRGAAGVARAGRRAGAGRVRRRPRPRRVAWVRGPARPVAHRRGGDPRRGRGARRRGPRRRPGEGRRRVVGLEGLGARVVRELVRPRARPAPGLRQARLAVRPAGRPHGADGHGPAAARRQPRGLRRRGLHARRDRRPPTRCRCATGRSRRTPATGPRARTSSSA